MWRLPSTGSGVLGGGTDCFNFNVFLLQHSTLVQINYTTVQTNAVCHMAAVLQKVPEGLGDHWHISRQYLC